MSILMAKFSYFRFWIKKFTMVNDDSLIRLPRVLPRFLLESTRPIVMIFVTGFLPARLVLQAQFFLQAIVSNVVTKLKKNLTYLTLMTLMTTMIIITTITTTLSMKSGQVRVTSLELLSLAEFSDKQARPKITNYLSQA